MIENFIYYRVIVIKIFYDIYNPNGLEITDEMTHFFASEVASCATVYKYQKSVFGMVFMNKFIYMDRVERYDGK